MTMRLVRRVNRPIRRPATASQIMIPNPKSIDQAATVRETAEILQRHEVYIAPVIDDAGRPIGVVSRTDLLDYWGRRRDRLAALAAGELEAASAPGLPGDELTVREIMTPVVFGVRTNAPITSVIEKMLALEVRCLFVTDEHGVFIGTISVFDVLRHVVQHGTDTTRRDKPNRVAGTIERAGRPCVPRATPP